jgi:glutathione S-transferase
MEVYFAPLSCSLATRIALYEAQQPATFHEVELSSKRLKDSGRDYREINPKGQVPALRTDQGEILTENAAILQYVADFARARGFEGLAPAAGSFERSRLQQWLHYVGTEIHKACFYVLFSPGASAEVKAYAKAGIEPKYAFLSQHLAGREFLLNEFSVADAYLVTSLGWAAPADIDLARWPVLQQYRERLLQRPALARAWSEELQLRTQA